MKMFVLAIFFTLAISVAASAQKCKEYTTAASAFAFCPPAGWQGKQETGRKHLTFEQPEGKGLAATMTVDEDNLPIDREAFALRMIKGTIEADKIHKLIAISNVESTSGLEGTAIFFGIEKDQLKLTQAYLIFAGPKDAKFTFVVTGPAGDASIGKVIEAAFLSLHIK